MRKLKRLVYVLLGAALALSVFASACDSSQGASKPDTALVGLTLETDYAKKTFEFGEPYSSESLVVNAILKNVKTELETPTDVTAKAQIDSSAYNSEVAGKYEIYVSYTHAGVTRSTGYEVEVKAKEPVFGGITVEYVQGFENTHKLGYGELVTDITPQLVVKRVNGEGEVAEELSANDYNTELYLGSVKQSSWQVGGGAYTIIVSLKSDPSVTNFINYYVVDTCQSIKFDANPEAVTAIDQWSNDSEVKAMAATWKFTVSYLSTASKALTVADAGVSYKCNPEVDGQQSVSVMYTERDALGDEVTRTTVVPITVRKVDASVTNYTYSLDALKAQMQTRLKKDPADKDKLAKADFTGENAFLTFVEDGAGTADQYRTNGCIEIKEGRLQVTFKGKGSVSVTFSSTGGSNVSGAALLDEYGNYMPGSSASANELLLDDDDGNRQGLFTTTGTGQVTVKFSVLKPGTYTIYCMYTSPSGSRGSRIYGISMQDVVIANAEVA